MKHGFRSDKKLQLKIWFLNSTTSDWFWWDYYLKITKISYWILLLESLTDVFLFITLLKNKALIYFTLAT